MPIISHAGRGIHRTDPHPDAAGRTRGGGRHRHPGGHRAGVRGVAVQPAAVDGCRGGVSGLRRACAGTAAAAGAYVKAGLCRLKTRDDKGAFALFRQVADDPAAAKSAPDAAASAFDQSTFNSQHSTFKCMCGVKATRRDDCGGRFLRPGVDGGCRKTYVGAVFRSERESRSDVRKRVRLHGEHRRVGWVRRLHTAWRRLFLVCGRVPFCRSEFQLLRERLWDGGVSPGADAAVKRANLRLPLGSQISSGT